MNLWMDPHDMELGVRQPSNRVSPGAIAFEDLSPWNLTGLKKRDLAALRPKIADCTLRDGEQQPGIVFPWQAKVELAAAIGQLGVSDIEAGTPASSPEDAQAIRQIVDLGLGCQISALARATTADVDLVAHCGADAVRISFPISSIQRSAKFNVPDSEYIAQALTISEYAKKKGLVVVFSPYDTTRADRGLLRRLLTEFQLAGTVDRVRLVDTAGVATPEAIRYLVRFARSACSIPLEIHCHNDFGLATANTISAALAGAEYLSVTVNGIGERGGNASLEEVVVSLKVLYGVELPIRTVELSRVSRLVARKARLRLHAHKAVVGRNAFRHETGMVVAGVLKNPATAEPYAPELVGQRRSIVLGRSSGKAAIRYELTRLRRELDEETVELLLEAVKERSSALARSLTSKEFVRLIDDAFIKE